MTLEPVSIQQDLKQAIPRGHDPFAIIIEPAIEKESLPAQL